MNEPSCDLHQTAGAFFTRSYYMIAKDLLEYLQEEHCMNDIIYNLEKEIQNRGISRK